MIYENFVEKEEVAHVEQFLLLRECFQLNRAKQASKETRQEWTNNWTHF